MERCLASILYFLRPRCLRVSHYLWLRAGSGQVDIAGKQASGIRSNAIGQKSQVDQNALNAQIQSIMQNMQTGLSGMSTSSSGGDLLAGLTSLANIFSGGLVGLGTQGLDILGGGNKKGGGNVSGWDAFTKRMG